MGGGNFAAGLAAATHGGLSPRGRGKPGVADDRHMAFRSIPAWAGETDPMQEYGEKGEVYPRVGGGNDPAPFRWDRFGGLSPRGRGKRPGNSQENQGIGSIPAWAGETCALTIRTPGPRVYPRVGGGNSPGRTDTTISGGLSPRGRGKPIQMPAGQPPGRSIPAWAGETGQ